MREIGEQEKGFPFILSSYIFIKKKKYIKKPTRYFIAHMC